MKLNQKRKNRIHKVAIEGIKLIGEFIVLTILGIGLGIMFIAADMAEHPDMSGYDPETQPYEIAVDIVKDIATA